MKTLPPFPVDDATLSAVEHALGARLTINDAGEHEVVGADMNLPKLLDFLSGYDPTKVAVIREGDPSLPGFAGAEMVEYVGGPLYVRDDIIRALIDEVRRLRQEVSQ